MNRRNRKAAPELPMDSLYARTPPESEWIGRRVVCMGLIEIRCHGRVDPGTVFVILRKHKGRSTYRIMTDNEVSITVSAAQLRSGSFFKFLHVGHCLAATKKPRIAWIMDPINDQYRWCCYMRVTGAGGWGNTPELAYIAYCRTRGAPTSISGPSVAELIKRGYLANLRPYQSQAIAEMCASQGLPAGSPDAATADGRALEYK